MLDEDVIEMDKLQAIAVAAAIFLQDSYAPEPKYDAARYLYLKEKVAQYEEDYGVLAI